MVEAAAAQMDLVTWVQVAFPRVALPQVAEPPAGCGCAAKLGVGLGKYCKHGHICMDYTHNVTS